MAVGEVPRDRLNLGWELCLDRLLDHTRRALSSSDQREVGTNAYSALMLALHWLEITKLGSKTTCHTERIDTELRTTLSRLSAEQLADERAHTEAWIVFYYWIVGYWGADPDSVHVKAVQRSLFGFLLRFLDVIGHAGSLPQLLPDAATALASPSNDELTGLLDEVRRLYEELDVGEW